MAAEKDERQKTGALKQELKLQINQALFSKGLISREIYDLAKIKILQETT